MPDQKTHADSIRLYLTGAASQGAAQADPNLSLGGFRSSSEITHLAYSVSSPIANLTIDFLAGANGTGTGTITVTGSDTLTWTPPGGSAGPAVTILNGETKILEAAGAPEKFIRISRTSADALTGTATLTLTDQFNNVIGMDNVSSAEAAAGDTEYRAIMLKNEADTEVKNVKIYIGTLGAAKTSGGAQLSASGGGSIGLAAGNFNDWPDSGFARIETNAGTLREIVYYSSRTATTLTVPGAGRSLLGTSNQAGASTDVIYPVPGLRIATETPSSDEIQEIADESTAPTGITWRTGITAAGGIDVGDVGADVELGLWFERSVVTGATAEASVLNMLKFSFDAA